jgi:hypothetical protein
LLRPDGCLLAADSVEDGARPPAHRHTTWADPESAASGGGRWLGLQDRLGELTQVLRGGSEVELIVDAQRAAQSQAIET